VYKKLFLFMLVLSVACIASAAIVELQDVTLLAFTDIGGTGASTLDLITDIAGDPGVQYDFTWANRVGTTDIVIGQDNPTEIGIGDIVSMQIKNLDPLYSTLAKIYMEVDGWNPYEGLGVWIAAGGTETLTMANPATTATNRFGIKLGTGTWTGRPDGSSSSVQIIPEPATMVLLGLGSLILRRKRS